MTRTELKNLRAVAEKAYTRLLNAMTDEQLDASVFYSNDLHPDVCNATGCLRNVVAEVDRLLREMDERGVRNTDGLVKGSWNRREP